MAKNNDNKSKNNNDNKSKNNNDNKSKNNNDNKSKNNGGSKQTGWGGDPSGVQSDLHEFNYGTSINLGQENAPTKPFWTQQDIEEYQEAKEQYESGLKALDREFESRKASNAYEEAEIESGRKQSISTTNWDAAGRGLFHSSIRNSDLSDIDATAEIKKKFLSDGLAALQVYDEKEKEAAANKWKRYEEAYSRKAVENAEGVDAQMPKYAVEPHFEKTAGPPSPPPLPKSQQPAKHTNGSKNFNTGAVPGSTNGGTEAPSNHTNKSGTSGTGSGTVAAPSKIKPSTAAGYATSKIAGKIYG